MTMSLPSASIARRFTNLPKDVGTCRPMRRRFRSRIEMSPASLSSSRFSDGIGENVTRSTLFLNRQIPTSMGIAFFSLKSV